MKAFGLALGSKLQADDGIFTNLANCTPQRELLLSAYQNSRVIEEVLGETRKAQDSGGIYAQFFQLRAKCSGNPKMPHHNYSVSKDAIIRSARHARSDRAAQAQETGSLSFPLHPD